MNKEVHKYSSLLEFLLIRIRQYIFDRKYAIVSASAAAFLAYTFMFTNKIVNFDEIRFLFGKGYTLSSGRWGLDLLSLILPNYSMPWFWGVITILVLILSICIIIDIFEVKSTIFQAVLAAVIIVFPSEIGTFLYMFTSSSYAISFLFAVLAVRCIKENGAIIKVLGVLSAVISMSIYQAYISVTASFLVLLLLKDLLSGKKNPIYILKKGILFVALLGIIGALYYVSTLFILNVSDQHLNAWVSRATSESSGLLVNAIRSWKLFLAMILLGIYGLETTTISQIAHIAIILLSGIASLITVIKQKSISAILLYLLMAVFILPLSINFIVLLIGEAGVHALTLYSFVAIYIFIYITFDTFSPGLYRIILRDISFVLLSLVVISNAYIANKVYLKQYLIYENTYSFYQSIITQVQQTPGFDEDCTLAILNSAEGSMYLKEFGEDSIYGLTEHKSEGISNEFITYYLGFDIPMASNEEKELLVVDSRIINMPVYPFYGYIQKIDDYIVVKLGN